MHCEHRALLFTTALGLCPCALFVSLDLLDFLYLLIGLSDKFVITQTLKSKVQTLRKCEAENRRLTNIESVRNNRKAFVGFENLLHCFCVCGGKVIIDLPFGMHVNIYI